jgi:hypothetical protein
MTKEELLKEISQTLFKVKADKLANLSARAQNIGQLLELTFYPKKEIAFRAAWVLENVYYSNPNAFLPHLEEFKGAYCRQKNLSCQRHYTKIMMDITGHKKDIPNLTINLFDFEAVTETTFEWLINPKTPVAVQVNCLDILYNLSSRYHWIKDELKAQTEFLLRDGSAAMQSRGRRILEKLNRTKTLL